MEEQRIRVGNELLLVQFPNSCPHCHQKVSGPSDLNFVHASWLINTSTVEAVFCCWRLFASGCYRHFLVHYDTANNMEIKGTFPVCAKNDFPICIHKISFFFSDIYNQADTALGYGLDQVAGAGFRKALEYLIKDYAKHCTSQIERSIIEDTFCGEVIKKYIADIRIQDMARRALWLGNDETHYTRRWGDKDIDDLKKLLSLTIKWIENDLLSKEYLNSMKAISLTSS